MNVTKVVIDHTPLDPGLAADLRWHFLHAIWQQHLLAPLLHDHEGFDFEASIAEVWQSHRTGHDEDEQAQLAPYALVLGDKEALRLTLRRLTHMREKTRREQILHLLTPRLATDLPPEEAYGWAVENFPALRFDPVSRRYQLPETPPIDL